MSEEEREKNKKELIEWLAKVNEHALVPITSDNYEYLSRIIEPYQDSDFWNHISTDDTAMKYFKITPMDPSEGMWLIDTDYLVAHKGNEYIELLFTYWGMYV